MEPLSGVHKVHNPIRNFLIRVMIFGVFLSLVRFVYVVTTTASLQESLGLSCDSSANLCLFSSSEKTVGENSVHSSEEVRFSIDPNLRKLWKSKDWRERIDFYSAQFQNLTQLGFLSLLANSLVIPVKNQDKIAAQQVLALKEIGVGESVGIGKKGIPPIVVSAPEPPGVLLPFDDESFDFIFAGDGAIDAFPKKVGGFADEIGRVLRPSGIAVIHTLLAKDMYSLNSFSELFNCCKVVKNRRIGVYREFILKKHRIQFDRVGIGKEPNSSSINKSNYVCSVPQWRKGLVHKAEPLIMEEPLKPWITLKRNIQNIRYLPSMVGIAYKRRYVYVDLGARSYGSSIVSWFKKQYPKQNQTFEIYAIEADHTFHGEYAEKKGVTLLPYAAWVKNETLIFEVNGGGDGEKEKGRGMGRIRTVGKGSRTETGIEESNEVIKVQGFDFARWLMATVSKQDFVVMKMDVEGTEFDLIPRLIETGAICLIDEVFLECHYNRWQRSSKERTKKYRKTYGECIDLFTSLRENGVLVHQWW